MDVSMSERRVTKGDHGVRVAARWGALMLALGLADVALGQPQGRVLLLDGPSVAGTIVAVSPAGVDVEDSKGEKRNVEIERIRDVQFSGEPQLLRAARAAVISGRPAQALDDLDKIDKSEFQDADELVLKEVEYVRAAALAGKASLTGGDLAGAEKAARDYLANHGTSHHVYAMQELLGNVLARAGKFADAANAYATLDKGPPAFRVRSATARAALLFEQQKYDEAIAAFAAASKIDTDPKDAASAAQKREAELGVARCLSRQGKAAEAVTRLQEILKLANPEQKELMARAYAVLGDAYRSAGKDQDALISFLTVDLVYNTVSEARAEALFNLAQLWERGKFPERARDARQQLESTYPDSPWTKKLAGAGS